MFAEDMNYFDTTVPLSRSIGEVGELLDNFGASASIVSQGRSDGKLAIAVRFQYASRTYRFTFIPYPCRNPEKTRKIGGRYRTNAEQAGLQVGRIAVNFVKAILTAAEMNPAALFGFLELPGYGSRAGAPVIASEIPVEDLTGLLPPPVVYRQLPE